MLSVANGYFVGFRQQIDLMQDLKAIGKNIIRLRKAKGLTQEDLAGAAEVDRSYLSEIENGHKNFSMDILAKIAKALGATPNDVLGS